MNQTSLRAAASVKSAVSPALKTAWWMIRLTVLISFAITVLQYFGVVAMFARLLNPVFGLAGLPGESAVVFISAYFVNIYSALAAIVALDLDSRSVTILAVMCLCAHNMIVETAVQKKTGSSALRMILLRTLAAILSAFVLNMLLPAQEITANQPDSFDDMPIGELASDWTVSTGKLILKMFSLILLLNIVQRLLAEFGVIRIMSKVMRPALKVFGLPAKTSFLWIVANVLGLAYGAAVMIEETKNGKIGKNDADLLNHHIAISHSNIEDISLFLSTGVGLGWMLVPRLTMAAVAVWSRRIFSKIRA